VDATAADGAVVVDDRVSERERPLVEDAGAGSEGAAVADRQAGDPRVGARGHAERPRRAAGVNDRAVRSAAGDGHGVGDAELAEGERVGRSMQRDRVGPGHGVGRDDGLAQRAVAVTGAVVAVGGLRDVERGGARGGGGHEKAGRQAAMSVFRM
jgi:hypothetical protein